MGKLKCTAIILCAGQGKRMRTNVQKQYLNIADRPVVYYALRAFQNTPIIDEIILVVGEGQELFCRNEIVDQYNLDKVTAVVEGGKERYHSVLAGLKCTPENGYVFIHDGARPLVTEDIIKRAYEEVKQYDACAVGMPVKDTIKKIDKKGFAVETPDRETLWLIQTPQVFKTELIKAAYQRLMLEPTIQVTDDAMVVEQMLRHPVKLVEG
ncbi:MAG: 2-C-methyl-D-erythritol 4-phosphate cytidylyltransferase, partial [Lachnospiraceae bacterium]